MSRTFYAANSPIGKDQTHMHVLLNNPIGGVTYLTKKATDTKLDAFCRHFTTINKHSMITSILWLIIYIFAWKKAQQIIFPQNV